MCWIHYINNYIGHNLENGITLETLDAVSFTTLSKTKCVFYQPFLQFFFPDFFMVISTSQNLAWNLDLYLFYSLNLSWVLFSPGNFFIAPILPVVVLCSFIAQVSSRWEKIPPTDYTTFRNVKKYHSNPTTKDIFLCGPKLSC